MYGNQALLNNMHLIRRSVEFVCKSILRRELSILYLLFRTVDIPLISVTFTKIYNAKYGYLALNR